MKQVGEDEPALYRCNVCHRTEYDAIERVCWGCGATAEDQWPEGFGQ